MRWISGHGLIIKITDKVIFLKEFEGGPSLGLGLSSTLTWEDKKAEFPIITKMGKRYSIMFRGALRIFTYNISTNEVIFP